MGFFVILLQNKFKLSFMKKLLLVSLLFLGFVGHSQKQVFESPELASLIKEHKTVAILPFVVKITYKKQPKNFSVEANRDQELKMSKSIQSSMYTFLLRKADSYTVTF